MNSTPEQLEEIKKCMDPVTGPEYFLRNFCMVQHPTRGSILFEMQQHHLDYLHNIHSNQQSINMMSRQLGKTTMLAGYALWMATFTPACTILLGSNRFAGAKDIMQKVHFGYDNLLDYIKAKDAARRVDYIEFDNDARIMTRATAEDACRGMALTMIMLDEFAFVNDAVAHAFLSCVMPALSNGGKIVIASSFNTENTTFYKLWVEAVNKKNSFSPFEAIWDDDPTRDEQWATQQRKYLGDSNFCREHLNCTLDLAEA